MYIEKGWYDWEQRAKATIIVLVGMLVPALVMALWQQHHAREGLADHGISIQPEIGLRAGQRLSIMSHRP